MTLTDTDTDINSKSDADTEDHAPAVMLGLHEITDALIPREPRLGGSCVPVPDDRIAALTRSGPVVLGLQPGFAHTDDFAASVVKELRALLRLPASHTCVLVPAPPRTVAHLLSQERWAVAHDVAVPPAPESIAPVGGSGRWTSADLSRTSWPLHDTLLGDLDVACFCPSWLLGTVPGCTVLTLSPRAAAVAREEQGGGPFTVRSLMAEGGPGLSATDLMMLAHGVRSLAESEPERYEDDIAARLGLLRARCAALPWLAGAPHRPGRDLAAVVPTALAPGAVRRIADFLEAHAMAYGLADPERPGVLRIGLYRTVTDDDLTRLIGLLDMLVRNLLRDLPAGAAR